MEERKFYHGFLEYISKSIPSTMSFLASLIFILIMTAPTIQTVDVDVDGPLIIDIGSDKEWITVEVIDYSGNMTLELVRNNGQHCCLHVIDRVCYEMMIRYKDKNTSAYLILNGTGWVHFLIHGYSQRVNIVFW